MGGESWTCHTIEVSTTLSRQGSILTSPSIAVALVNLKSIVSTTVSGGALTSQQTSATRENLEAILKQGNASSTQPNTGSLFSVKDLLSNIISQDGYRMLQVLYVIQNHQPCK